MKTVIMILAIMILLLITYLFFLKKDLKRIRKNIKTIQETDSNHLIHSETGCRELKDLIHEINNILRQTKKEKIRFERKTQE